MPQRLILGVGGVERIVSIEVSLKLTNAQMFQIKKLPCLVCSFCKWPFKPELRGVPRKQTVYIRNIMVYMSIIMTSGSIKHESSMLNDFNFTEHGTKNKFEIASVKEEEKLRDALQG